jgi:hypothetical protein
MCVAMLSRVMTVGVVMIMRVCRHIGFNEAGLGQLDMVGD